MIFTFGRGGWIAGAIAVLGPLLMTRGAKWRWVFVVALGAAVLVLVPVLSSSLGDRLEDPTNILGREVVWNVGLHAAMGAPVFGHGFWGDYTFFATTADTLVARGLHNIYLLVFYDFGLVGLVLFIATWLAFWTEAAIQVRSHADSRRAVYLTASAVLLAVLIFEAAANLLWDFSPSIYLWLTLAWASAWGESAGSVHVA
jgi:O-antigen ligase